MINLVVALAVESRPLIEHFRLSEDRSAVGFRIFRKDDMRLIVTGRGRVSCAAGVAALACREAGGSRASTARAWLNVGIAGHADLDIGVGVHALSVVEAATQHRWYPVQVAPLAGRGEALCTVDVPETGYPGPYVYDMEASAFCGTAARFATSELIQVYKIISDNRETGVESVEKHGVRDLMTRHLPAIEEMASALSGLAADVDATRPRLDELERMLNRWHFTASQQHQLRELLRKWETLGGSAPLLDEELNRCPSAKSVLAEIGARLDDVYGAPGALER